MAIRVALTSSSTNTSGYLHGKDEVSAIDTRTVAPEYCTKDLPGSCGLHVPAFAYLTDESDTYRNDFRSFIYEVPTGATITAKLIDTISGTEYTITDNTYGQLFATGTVKTNVWAFILKWYNVADNIGYSVFKFNVTITNSSATELTNYTTPCFNLQPYTCDDSHETVKITTWQKGYIVDGFDYRGLDYLLVLPSSGGSPFLTGVFKDTWPQEFRWYGRFYPEKPTYVNDTIQDSNRNEIQVQSQIVENYVLRLDHIYGCLTEPFLKDQFLAGEIYVSDYNTNAVDKYDMVRVNPVDIAERTNFPMTKNEYFTINLEQFKKATLKRH